jgi:hypothetical protein
MLIFLTTLLAALRAIFRSRTALELENLALRYQIGVLQRSTTKRPTGLMWCVFGRNSIIGPELRHIRGNRSSPSV